MFWGGCLAVILVALLVIPMMACDGHLMKTHSVCLGGSNVTNLFNTLAPVTKMAAMIYILGLFPLGHSRAVCRQLCRPRQTGRLITVKPLPLAAFLAIEMLRSQPGPSHAQDPNYPLP